MDARTTLTGRVYCEDDGPVLQLRVSDEGDVRVDIDGDRWLRMDRQTLHGATMTLLAGCDLVEEGGQVGVGIDDACLQVVVGEQALLVNARGRTHALSVRLCRLLVRESRQLSRGVPLTQMPVCGQPIVARVPPSMSERLFAQRC